MALERQVLSGTARMPSVIIIDNEDVIVAGGGCCHKLAG